MYIYSCNTIVLPKRRPGRLLSSLGRSKWKVRDNSLYTTTNKCLECLPKIMYTVF